MRTSKIFTELQTLMEEHGDVQFCLTIKDKENNTISYELEDIHVGIDTESGEKYIEIKNYEE